MIVTNRQFSPSVTPRQSSRLSENCILGFLPPNEYARLLPDLHPLRLPKGKVLFHAGDDINYCYFPLNGMISLLPMTEAGETIEVSVIGCEGMVGIAAILQTRTAPYEMLVQCDSDVLRIRADILKREFFNRDGALQSLLLRYTHALLCEVSQSAVCNRFHTVKQRLCRWLLVADDRVKSPNFSLTHEFIGRLMGIPRTNATMTINELRKAGLISQRRGHIAVIDRRGLKRQACECYEIIKNEGDIFA